MTSKIITLEIFEISRCLSVIYISLEIYFQDKTSGGSRAAATSKMERFVIIVNGFQPLTVITKRSILDVAAALAPPLKTVGFIHFYTCFYPFLFITENPTFPVPYIISTISK